MEGHGEKGRSNEPNDSKSCHWIGRSETTKTQNIPTITKNKQRNFEYLQNLIKIYQFFLSGCCMAQRRSLSVLSAKTKWMSQIHWKSFSTKATNLNEQWNKITNSRRVQGGGCQSCGWSVSQRSIKGQQVKVENTDFVFFDASCWGTCPGRCALQSATNTKRTFRFREKAQSRTRMLISEG